MTDRSHAITACRFCKSNALQEYLDLGFTPLADRFLSRSQLNEPEPYYPLRLVMCRDCGLHQLDFSVDPVILYRQDYPYESSLTNIAICHYNEFAESVVKRFRLTDRDLVIDIGSNAGTLLKGFQERGFRTLGVDPAVDIARRANDRGITTIPDFFSLRVARSIRKKYGLAKVVVATNVFAHIFDHDEFIKALRLILRNDGIFIFESPHLSSLLDSFEYDTIYHEHLLYLSLKPVKRFFQRWNFDIFAVEKYPIHGGSFRVYCGARSKHQILESVMTMEQEERQKELYSMKRLKLFADQVYSNRSKLYTLLWRIKQKGKHIAAVSAPAKGMTLLNYCHIGRDLIDFATEKSLLKIGRYTPGTHIPIFPDNEIMKRKPGYALLLAWNFSPEIMKNLHAYRQSGGRFIIPIPRPVIL